jgi:hypothetical protein
LHDNTCPYASVNKPANKEKLCYSGNNYWGYILTLYLVLPMILIYENYFFNHLEHYSCLTRYFDFSNVRQRKRETHFPHLFIIHWETKTSIILSILFVLRYYVLRYLNILITFWMSVVTWDIFPS